MIEQLKHAYKKALKNLVFIDFANKKFIGGGDTLEIELSKEKACCKDLLTVIDLHLSSGEYDQAKERTAVLNSRLDYIECLENQVKEQRRNKLFDIASQLKKQGKSGEVVKIDANPS